MKNVLLIILATTVVVLLLVGAVLFSIGNFSLVKPDRTESSHELVLTKVTALAKMELVRFQFQDVVSHKIVRDWLPDPQVMLFVYGEAVGCIDFGKIDSSSISFIGDSLLSLQVPSLEICYAKIDHERSRVYDSRYSIFSPNDIVSEAYQKAEEEIMLAALQDQIIEKTRAQAEQMLVPMLEGLSGRQVELNFPVQMPVNENQ